MVDLFENFEVSPSDENPYEPVNVFLFREEIEDNLLTELSALSQNEAKILCIYPLYFPNSAFLWK